MVEDHADYLLYSFRRFTLQAFEELIQMMDDRLYQNRYVIKAAYNYLRLDHRVDKVREAERTKLVEAMATYKSSKDYETLVKELQKLEDEDEYKTDADPDGYFTFENLLEHKHDLSLFVMKICSKNQDAPELHGKAIKHFLREQPDGKTRAHSNAALFFSALRSAICLHEHHRQNPRYISGMAFFFAFWIKHAEALKQLVNEERLYNIAASEVKELGCPGSLQDIRKWAHSHAATLPKNIRVTNELLKLDLNLFSHADATSEKLAIEQLQAHVL